MASEVVQQGKAARSRLKQGSGSWSDWVLVGHALIEGRAIAMRHAGTTSPAGRGYFRRFRRLAAQQPFGPARAGSREAPRADG